MSNAGSLRQIRRRIRTVENTKKITRAMEMVAAAKLRRFQDFLVSAKPYTERLAGFLADLLEELPPSYDHPFLEKRGEVKLGALSKGTCYVLFTSDTGLCGTYNRVIEEFVTNEWGRNPEKKGCFIFVGKHGAQALRKKGFSILATFSDLRVSRVDEILEGLRERVEEVFLNEVDEVEVFYTRMESLSRTHPTQERLLPMGTVPKKGGSPPKWGQSPAKGTVPILVEPDFQTVLDKLLPTFFEARLRFIFYHALLTEQIARMTAMHQATQNAEDMIEELTLLRNKARQAAITKEIIEVVSGSRALKLK